MGSGAVIYVPSFIKIGSGVQKLIGGGGGIHRERHGQQRDLVSLFFQNKESRLIKGSLWDHLAVYVSVCPHLSLLGNEYTQQLKNY
jgi:hypothetical protein